MRCIVVLFVVLFSCNSFTTKKTSSEVILNEELEMFNWNDVDIYPTFLPCRKEKTKVLKKECFQRTLTQHIVGSLKSKPIRVSKSINDTIQIDFEISDKGKLSLKSLSINDETNSEIPEIDTYILESLKTLPAILPAIKRGQHVKTQFKLPVVIKVD